MNTLAPSPWDSLETVTRNSFDLVLAGFAYAQSNRKNEEVHKAKLEALLRSERESSFQPYVIFKLEGRRYAIETQQVLERRALSSSMLLTKSVSFNGTPIPLRHLKRQLGVLGEMGNVVLIVQRASRTHPTTLVVEAWAVDAVIGQKELRMTDARTLPASPGLFPERQAIDVYWKNAGAPIWHLR